MSEVINPAVFLISLILIAYSLTKIWQALIRDFFAWTIWQQDNKYINNVNKIHRPDEMAQWAYKMADAMMKERSK